MTIVFAPNQKGSFTSTLQIVGNGGETHVVHHNTICGNPLVLSALNSRIIYPGDHYGHPGLSFIKEKVKKKVTILSNLEEEKNIQNINESSGLTNESQKNVRNKLLNIDMLSRLTIEDGVRAVETWHSKISQQMSTLKMNVKKETKKKKEIFLFYNLEKKKAMQLLKKIDACSKKYNAAQNRVSLCDSALKNATKAWEHASTTNGSTTIDHKRLYLCKKEKKFVTNEEKKLFSDCIRFVHIATGKYLSEGAAREWSTVVDISIPSPSFKPVSLSFSRSPLSKTPKQV